MKKMADSEPADVWKYFDEICKIPRPSKKEDKIIKYLVNFAKEHNLQLLKDDVGNVLISKPACKGFEHKKSVVLQSHMDMVCEKNSDCTHNFDKDPIQTYIDNGWIRARGTTLGADDGIGMAIQLAILDSSDIKHGPLECLFTVDEETGMTGAFGIQPGFFNSKVLLNLDSEDEGQVFIGCAGGINTSATFVVKTKKVKDDMVALKISIGGLKGGHSGDDINKERGNAIKILNLFLWNVTDTFKIRISEFRGGNLMNAIPREAFAVICVPQQHKDKLMEYFKKYSATIKNEFQKKEPDIELALSETKIPEKVIGKKLQKRLLNTVYACPNGVIAMSADFADLVESSSNLAKIEAGSQEIIIGTSQRSSVDSAKIDIANRIKAVFDLAGAKVTHSSSYPGWKPDLQSQIMLLVKNVYKELFKKEPRIRAIHAGLECGLFLEKFRFLDMISFGPTIVGAHSPDERLEIESVKKFWKLLTEVLKRIPDEK